MIYCLVAFAFHSITQLAHRLRESRNTHPPDKTAETTENRVANTQTLSGTLHTHTRPEIEQKKIHNNKFGRCRHCRVAGVVAVVAMAIQIIHSHNNIHNDNGDNKSLRERDRYSVFCLWIILIAGICKCFVSGRKKKEGEEGKRSDSFKNAQKKNPFSRFDERRKDVNVSSIPISVNTIDVHGLRCSRVRPRTSHFKLLVGEKHK